MDNPETGNIEQTRHNMKKKKKTKKTQHENKQNKNTTPYVLDTTMCKQIQIT